MSVLRWTYMLTLYPLLACVSLAWGQGPCTLVLSGTVVDEHDKDGLSFAEVLVVELGMGAVADLDGRYRIPGLCAGRYTIRVMHLGCDPVERPLALERDMVMDFRLEHHAAELKEYEVASKRPDEHVGQAHEELDERAMEQRAGRSLAEMLSTISGVNMVSSGPTINKPMIHGLSGNRILTLNQGIRQEDQQWGTEHAPNIDPFSSNKITVVKGAASVQYGSDALGGVIITEPVELPKAPGIRGEVRGTGSWNGRGGGGGGSLEGGVKGLKGLGWRVQGTGRYLGDSEAAQYTLSNTGLRESGASASLGYRDHRWNATVFYSRFTRELGILRASHIGNLTDLNNAISSGKPWYTADPTYDIAAPRQTVEHQLAKVEVGHAISDRDRLVATYGYQTDDRQEYDIRRGGRSGLPALDLNLVTHTGDLVLKHWIGVKMHGKVGFNGLFQENVNVPGTGIRPLIPNYRKRSAGGFLLEHYPLSKHVEIEVGARLEATRLDIAKYDRNDVLVRPELQFINNAFSGGVNWSVRDSIRLRFNVGSAYRPPHVSELYSEGLHHGAAAIEVGDENLRSERSLKATADLEASWLDGKLTTDLTIYADRINDFIYLRPAGTQLTIRGAFPVFNYVATDAFLHGLDATLVYNLTPKWSIRSKASLVRGRDLVRNEWLFQMPGDRLEQALVFGQENAGAWKDIQCSLTGQWVFQQVRIPVGLDFMDPPSTYRLLGISVSAARSLGKNELRIILQGSNLLNAAYRDQLDRFRYFADARGLDISCTVAYHFGKRL